MSQKSTLWSAFNSEWLGNKLVIMATLLYLLGFHYNNYNNYTQAAFYIFLKERLHTKNEIYLNDIS